MATRGTEFIGTALLKEVAGNYDRRISDLQQEIEDLQYLTTEERRRAWRESAERAFATMLQRINEATDTELSDFKVGSAPRPDDFKYTIQSKEAEIDRLGKAKDKALAYINSLAADQGVVTLSAADLRRIGYGL